MLKKLCSKCGAAMNQGVGSLCGACSATHQKYYDKYKRSNKGFYKTREWRVLTALCKARFNGLDAYEYFVNKRVMKGVVSHHIIPVEDDISLAHDPNNLIYLSNATHKRIHVLYEKSEKIKKETQNLLKNISNSYINGEGIEGEFKKF